MPTKITKNSFQAGMDKDTDPKQVVANKYEDGYNVSLSQDGREKKLSSFLGTTTLQTISAAPVTDRSLVHIMGMYEANAKIGASVATQVDTNVAVVFVYDANGTATFSVFVIPEDGSAQYEIYTEEVTLSDSDRFVDCVIHKEGGTSYAYFTDAEQTPKKLPLDIITSGKGDATPYYNDEIFLIRTGFRGGISALDITTDNNGDLLCGTYQFAIRLFSNDKNKYTKWSMISQPAVIGMGFSNSQNSYGGVGYVSNEDIDVSWTTKVDYSAAIYGYTHYQIAVIENINGGKDFSLTVKVLQPETLSGTSATYNYNTNKQAKELIHIDELTVDDAAVNNLKSLAIKNNRMLALNVNYHPLDYDHPSAVSITASTAIAKSFTNEKAVAYRNYDNATNFVGHYRDELYRFGIVYEDKYGNLSKPKMIDFSGLAGNASATSKDFRFPAKTDGVYGSLLDTNGDIQALGLQLDGIDNHPSWAIGFHIVRVPRKKKILFQTPLVPSILVQPARALGNYPSQKFFSGDTDSYSSDVLNVEATNPEGTFVPKNFYHVLPKSLIRFGDFYGSLDGDGTIYATNDGATTGGGNNYDLYLAAGSAPENVITQSFNETLVLQSTDGATNYKFEVYVSGVPRAIIAADLVTIVMFRRVIGTSPWGSAVSPSPYINYETTTSISIDLSTYDYKFDIQSQDEVT